MLERRDAKNTENQRQNCRDCDKAKQGQWNQFDMRCLGCRARMVARSLHFWESKKAGRQTTTYRALCKRMGVNHEQVKAAA